MKSYFLFVAFGLAIQEHGACLKFAALVSGTVGFNQICRERETLTCRHGFAAGGEKSPSAQP